MPVWFRWGTKLGGIAGGLWGCMINGYDPWYGVSSLELVYTVSPVVRLLEIK